MFYKKSIFAYVILVIGLILIFNGCNKNDNVNATSYIKVIDKKNDGNEYWITVVNSYESNPQSIELKTSRNTWNLIKVNEIYFALYKYSKKPNRLGSLISINYPHENDN
ncbi:hypothetical protein SAMN05444162_1384 [Paenibacillaceae bacterium GAS479]|nr:hypothetical protein SAMN05444162_1384 [Paenibacillaceae bacterium GAS479]